MKLCSRCLAYMDHLVALGDGVETTLRIPEPWLVTTYYTDVFDLSISYSGVLDNNRAMKYYSVL